MASWQGPVKWGIIGCGDVCEVKSGPALQKTPHSELVAVMRRNGALAEDFAKRHGVARWYDTAEALIADPEVNAIYIATPPNVHLEYTRMAAAAGKPVYVEKPMARNYAECKGMIEACEAAGVPLLVAYYRRRLERFMTVKKWIAAGKIGAVRAIHINMRQASRPQIAKEHQLKNWRVDPAVGGPGGYFMDLASHQLDFLDDVFGPITQVKGMAANQAQAYEAEDMITAIWQHESGVMGSGSWSFAASESNTIDEGLVIGNKGLIRFPFFGKAWVEYEGEAGQERVEMERPAHVQQPLIETVVAHIRETGTCPSTGHSGARTNWVIDQIFKGEG
ncbi:MAG: Gfo/Idh/MocA family oxidoreductase [Bacteroidota bacterium]